MSHGNTWKYGETNSTEMIDILAWHVLDYQVNNYSL